MSIAYLYGGISKIADERFLNPSSPVSLATTAAALRNNSPVGPILGLAVSHSVAVGLLLAVTEIAVGLGLLAGLFTRVAAAGGVFLALTFWLTVSWQARPWFTSADLVYVFALIPLLIAGAGRTPSVDRWRAGVATRRAVQHEDRTRRALVLTAVTVVGALSAGAALARRPARRADLASRGEVLAAISEVPVGGGTQVIDAQGGHPTWVLQLQPGQFTAFEAACPHQGCPVQFVSAKQGFVCPCHQSTFDSAGKLLTGPATAGLAAVEIAATGSQIYRI